MKHVTWIGLAGTSLLLAATASAAWAGDGRTEINQTVVTAAGGFPFTITQPGSYVLTGDLTVPANTTGLVLGADGISLDLNGFAVLGPNTCDPSPGSCTFGGENGITIPSGPSPPGDRSSIRGGRVAGFPGSCVSIGGDSAAIDLIVHDCGFRGITTGERALVTGSRVSRTGLEGIALGTGSAYAHNVVAQAGSGSGGASPAILGGHPTAGNSCDDRSCSHVARLRYYLTPALVDGAGVGSACASGFHVASVFELINPGLYEYDRNLGFTLDASSAPYLGARGWAYVNGVEHCMEWTSTSAVEQGTQIRLTPTPSSQDLGIWERLAPNCNTTGQVWCVEN